MTRLKTRKSQLNNLETEVKVDTIQQLYAGRAKWLVNPYLGPTSDTICLAFAVSSFPQVSDRRKVLEGVKQKIDTSKEILRS